MKARGKRTARERDQLDLIAAMRASDTKLREAIITAFSHDNGRVLVAFGEVLRWMAPARGRR